MFDISGCERYSFFVSADADDVELAEEFFSEVESAALLHAVDMMAQINMAVLNIFLLK